MHINRQPYRLNMMVCLLLILVTLAVYWQSLHHDFVSFDDDDYVSENPYVEAGLTKEGVIWAFTTFHAGNWHPLTWLSHMLDCQLFGLRPGMHHLINLLLHIANSLLLFLALKRMTGHLWPTTFVAALFALHPLHVESVAWVSERKDVLSTLFWMLTIWTYAWYAEQPSLLRYVLILLSFALGLMAKPMLVTLPFVLLLVDYWPLGRLQFGQPNQARDRQKTPAFRLVLEKVPLFALTTVSSIVTYLAQQEGGLVAPFDVLPLKTRIANALFSYAAYLEKMIWPRHLAVLYPHPVMLPLWRAVGSGLLLVAVSVLVVRWARRYPYLITGWLWYLGTLVPVIGLVQVGDQSMADRYTYIPLIGIFIMVGWGVASLATRWRSRRMVIATSAVVVLIGLMMCTRLQVRHWQNSIVLFEHALNVTVDNYLAHNRLGGALGEQGRLDEAIGHFSTAVGIKPDLAEAHNNLGVALVRQGRLVEAIGHYWKALGIKPNYAEGHYNMGVALARQGRVKEAMGHLSEALRIKPDYADARYNLNALQQARESGK